MANTIYGMTNYYNLFTSPMKSTQDTPTNNFLYAAMANKSYMSTFSKKTSSEMSSYLSTLNSGVSELKSASKLLSKDSSQSSFNLKSVASTDSNSVTGSADSNADKADYTVKVSKLALSQVNTGKALTTNAASSISKGNNTVTMKLGNQSEKNITFNINENDTNKSSLDKMAMAINYARVGVTASVVTDSKAGTSSVKITSDKTGTDSSFTIADKVGNAVSATSSDSNSAQAQNTEYSIDGKEFTAQQNTVSLNNNKVTITFNKADNKDIKLSIVSDLKTVKEDIKDFVAAYNKTLDIANAYSSSFNGASNLKKELSSITASRASSLENIGISKKSDGSLVIDDKKLEKALNENLSQVIDTFKGSNGVAENTFNKSNEVLTSPAKYSKPADTSKSYYNYYGSQSAQGSFASIQNSFRGMVVDMLL